MRGPAENEAVPSKPGENASVYLQETKTQLFYAQGGKWVPSRNAAFDFETIGRAWAFRDAEKLVAVQVVLFSPPTDHLPALQRPPTAVSQVPDNDSETRSS